VGQRNTRVSKIAHSTFRNEAGGSRWGGGTGRRLGIVHSSWVQGRG